MRILMVGKKDKVNPYRKEDVVRRKEDVIRRKEKVRCKERETL